MTDLVDLNPTHRAIVEHILAEHVPECEVWAFGSRATWNARDTSDLDLAVVGDGPLSSRVLTMLREAFEESRLPMQVDVIDWNAITDSFREFIESDCIVVQEAPEYTDWPTVALSEVMELTLSSVDKKSKAGEHPVLLCNYTDVYKNDFILADMDFMPATATDREISRCSLVAGDVIITKDSEAHDDIGVPALVREHIPNLLCGYHLAILRAKSEIDGTYLFYALKAQEVQQQFHAYANGVTRFGLRKADIGLVELPLPPLKEQWAIARVLSTLDDKIELNRRMSKTLEEMAWAMFKSWFVDFDPVRAKAKGQPSGLPPDLDALFPASFEASELGKIPAGWEVRSLDEIAIFTNGLALQRFPSEGDGWLPVIKIAEMRRGFTERTGRASVNIDPRYIVEDGDVLFSWSGSLELVLWAHGRGALNQHLFRVTSDEFPRWFYLGWTREHLDEFREIAASKATTMGHIQRRHLTDAKVVVPSHEVVIAGNETLAPLVVQQLDRAIETRTLVTQRDALLPQLVSGKLRVAHMDVPDCGHSLTNWSKT